jgi:hypothetical protein
MALVGFRDRGCAEDVHTIFVALSSWKPFFFHGLKNESRFSDHVGAQDPGIQ